MYQPLSPCASVFITPTPAPGSGLEQPGLSPRLGLQFCSPSSAVSHTRLAAVPNSWDDEVPLPRVSAQTLGLPPGCPPSALCPSSSPASRCSACATRCLSRNPPLTRTRERRQRWLGLLVPRWSGLVWVL